MIFVFVANLNTFTRVNYNNIFGLRNCYAFRTVFNNQNGRFFLQPVIYFKGHIDYYYCTPVNLAVEAEQTHQTHFVTNSWTTFQIRWTTFSSYKHFKYGATRFILEVLTFDGQLTGH